MGGWVDGWMGVGWMGGWEWGGWVDGSGVDGWMGVAIGFLALRLVHHRQSEALFSSHN